MAVDLLSRTIRAQRDAAAQLKRCQAKGGDIFKGARLHLGWDQRKMADAMGVHFTYLSKIENGKLLPGKPVLESLHALLEKNGRTKG